MYRYIFPFAAFMLFTPLHASATPMQMQEPESEVPESEVEGPDAQAIPQSPGSQFSLEPEKPSEKAPTPVPEKLPGEGMQGGFNTVILQGLNKVTARASKIEAPIGSTVKFGTLEIIAKSCWKSAPEDRPENAAVLEIREIKQGEAPKGIFLGWMFSSSPGLSSLENPFYDITVVKCAGKPAEAKPAEGKPAESKK